MAVTRDEVKHVAALARLGITDDRADTLTAELNTILGHMEALTRVDPKKMEPVIGVGAESAPRQADRGPSVPLASSMNDFAPSVRDGFFIVPRLSTHETAEES
jgi:aspartyl-tRNA(Asn)/glutamyl-tRNA(Gln) amidotransferase subunit C